MASSMGFELHDDHLVSMERINQLKSCVRRIPSSRALRDIQIMFRAALLEIRLPPHGGLDD